MKNLKRILTFLLVMALLSGTAYGITYACESVWYPVMVNGTAMTFTEQGGLPMVYEGRTMLPLRAVAEALGVPIEWKNNQVEITTINTEQLKDACVMVYNGSNGQYLTQASGVLIDYDEVLTCYHCIDEGTLYSVVYDDSTNKQLCTLADTAQGEDAAILTPTNKTIKPVPIGDSDTVKVGDTVYVVSSPKESKNVVTMGTVTGKGTFDGISVFATTATTNGGSSGGACFNSNGELIGIVDGGSDDNKLSYIVPVNDIRKALAA